MAMENMDVFSHTGGYPTWKTLHLFAVDRQASNDGWETNLPQPFQVLQHQIFHDGFTERLNPEQLM